jgi:hypothetical protein
VGSKTSQIVFLKNKSNCDAHFQFVAEQRGNFSFDRVSGSIPPYLETYVRITFAPQAAGNFYRRIYCLVQNAPPKFVDVIGTAYDEENRPAPLYQRHVDRFRRRKQLGYGRMAPEQIEELFKTSELTKQRMLEPEEIPQGATASGESTRQDVYGAREFFLRVSDSKGELVMREEELDFGSCSRHSPPGMKSVSVTNQTNSKVMLLWIMPRSADGDREVDFAVIPPQADIGPKRTVTFQVQFRPSQDNFYYCQEVEAYGFFKTQRNFRLVSEESFTPPWHLPLRVVGHTFAGTTQFLPSYRVHMRGGRVAFPACTLGETCYQTVRITNQGSTPLQFAFKPDPSGTFDTCPRGGLIQPGTLQLVCFSFTPRDARRYNSTVRCVFNNSSQNTNQIRLTGQGSVPKCELEDGGRLFFKPTCLGLVTRRVFRVRNRSRIPMRFALAVPRVAAEVISVDPPHGQLNGNDVVELEWTFAPRAGQLYRFSVPFVVYQAGGQYASTSAPPNRWGPYVQRTHVDVIGQGTTGAIRFSPPIIDFGTVRLGTSTTLPLRLSNASDCNLRYNLEVVPAQLVDSIDADGDGVVEANELDAYQAAMDRLEAKRSKRKRKIQPMPAKNDNASNPTVRPRAVRFSKPKGLITASSSLHESVIFRPTRPGPQKFRVFWELQNVDGTRTRPPDDDDLKGDPLYCDVIGTAGYPSLSFVDVRSLNSTGGMPASWLWEQFSLAALNKELLKPLSEADVEYNNTEGLQQDPKLLSAFDISFMPAPIDSAPSIVVVQLKNTGELDAEWTLQTARDVQVEVELWADAGEPTEEQIRLDAIMDNGLFSIRPRSGKLAPGETCNVTFTYSYATTDPLLGEEHVLPIVFALKHGKQVRLMLRGKTLPPATSYLVPLHSTMQLESMPVGETEPVQQSVHIFNAGDLPCRYEVDQDALDVLKRDNAHGFPVLQSENVTGVIAPRTMHAVRFRFQPVEERIYNCDTRILYGPSQGRGGNRCRGSTRLGAGAKGHRGFSETNQSVSIRLIGCGVSPVRESLAPAVSTSLTQPGTTLADIALISLPGQCAAFHTDVVDFGNAPAGAKQHRILILRSKQEVRFRYAWRSIAPILRSGALKIFPMSGECEAGGNVVFKLTLFADVPEVFVHDFVSCVVEPLSNNGQPLTDLTDGGPQSKLLRPKTRRTSVITRSTRSQANRMEDISKQSQRAGLEVSTRSRTLAGVASAAKEPHIPRGPALTVLHVRVRGNAVGSAGYVQRGGKLQALRIPGDKRSSEAEGRVRVERKISPAVESYGSVASSDGFVSVAKVLLDEMITELLEDASLLAEFSNLSVVPKTPPYFVQATSRVKGACCAAASESEYKAMIAESAGALDYVLDSSGKRDDVWGGNHERRRELMCKHDVSDLCSRVLEETLYNIVQEATHGEFDVTKMPRTLVKSPKRAGSGNE